jgi:hypothetical protein
MQLKMGPASDCSFECELELPHCYVLYKLIESGWFMIPEWHYRIPSRAQGLQVAYAPTSVLRARTPARNDPLSFHA